MGNGLRVQLESDGANMDNHILGPSSAEAIIAIISPRFNMDGKPPAGRIVGLLDEHNIWAFICDPCAYEWRSILKLGGVARICAKHIIEHVVLLGKDWSTVDRTVVMLEFEVSGVCCSRTFEENA